MENDRKETETADRPTRNFWTDEASERLRALIASGTDVANAADALGRPVGSVQAQLSRMGISRLNLERRVRDRIAELGRAGWTLSRLSRQCGVDQTIAARALRQAGIEPRAISSYASGRYGRDIPMPAPGQIVTLPIAPPRLPPRTAFDDLAQTRKVRWTSEQVLEFEQRVRAGEELVEIAAAMGRSGASLLAKHRAVLRQIAAETAPTSDETIAASAADAGGKRPWTPNDDAVLRRMGEDGRSLRDVADAIGRTTAAVSTRRSVLGLGAARRAKSADTSETPAIVVEAPAVAAEPIALVEADSIAPAPVVAVPTAAPAGLSASLLMEIERFERRIIEDQATVEMMRSLAARIEARPG